MEDTKMTQEELESLRDKVLKEYEKRNIVFAGADGLEVANIDKFIEQPEEGILYDLNRSEAVVLTLINDPKWVNDYAVCKTIRMLKAKIDALEKSAKEITVFTKWCINNVTFNDAFDTYELWNEMKELSFNSLDQLYDYYKVNVLKK